MASEMLKAVLDTEAECSAKEAEAKKEAELYIQSSREQASGLVAQAKQEAEQLLADNEKDIAARSDAELQKARKEAQTECEAVSANAERNIGRVKKLVVEMLTEGSV